MSSSNRPSWELDSRKGIEEALQHVVRGWFPINRELLQGISGKARSGHYENRPGEFINDLKKDVALFCYCIRKLGSLFDKEANSKTPAELIALLTPPQREQLLTVPESILNTHTLDPSMKVHVMRLKHSVISSSTAETLAEHSTLNPDDAYICSVLRQLGINLIAWNYPRIYIKAISTVAQTGDDLEEALFKVLGYSPLHLGLRAAVEWCTNTEFQHALLYSKNDGVTSEEDVETLRRFCEIGEIVAAVSDPEYFPSAVAKWGEARDEISRYLGPSGLVSIKSKIEQNCGAYKIISPDNFSVDLEVEKHLSGAFQQIGERLLEQNSYAKRCSSDVIKNFRSVYEQIVPGQASPTAIKCLVDMVIPALGFTRGCVYLVDTRKMQAVPMLRIGDTKIDRFRPLNCSDSSSTSHPVVEALSYTAPIVQENAFLNGDQVSHVTGVFGSRDKVGVLYLEMSPELKTKDRQDTLTYFKAVRHCLNDCLNMK